MAAVPLLLLLAWVLFLARGTSAGPAIAEPGEFLVTLLGAITRGRAVLRGGFGFTLIFGLMRTVNMAHGSLFLMAAYLGITVQQTMVGKARNIEPADVSMAAWFVPLLVGALVAAVIGIIVQQVLLRWNEGQELRQADHAGRGGDPRRSDVGLVRRAGHQDDLARAVTHFFEIAGERYATSRLFMLGVAIVVGVALWLWLDKTRMGMIIRAGVDDRDMVRALGINILAVFAITFFVGAFLAGVGRVMGASFAGVAPGADGQWLLNSLVVVIVGGLGSLKGAVAGSLLFGLVVSFSRPTCPRSSPSTASS